MVRELQSLESIGKMATENGNRILEAGRRGEEVFLEGIIVPGELDEHFKITLISLSTDMELDLVIERDAKGDELFDRLRESVRVKGFIREAETGKKTIRITDYRILEKRTG